MSAYDPMRKFDSTVGEVCPDNLFEWVEDLT
jgi:hypothetical protein